MADFLIRGIGIPKNGPVSFTIHPAEEPCLNALSGCYGGMLAYLKEVADI